MKRLHPRPASSYTATAQGQNLVAQVPVQSRIGANELIEAFYKLFPIQKLFNFGCRQSCRPLKSQAPCVCQQAGLDSFNIFI
jgi:hypothetical protein